MDLLNNTRSRLTETEVHAIFNGEPYRNDWNVDRNQADDQIEEYYGELIRHLMPNALFDTYYSEEGGLGNYLEFLCYPKTADPYRGNAILVAVSWCAPVAAYGPTTVITTEQGVG